MQILGLLGMNFDAVVVEVEKSSLFFQIGSGHTVLKYPHLGDKIFKLMDPQDIQNCKEVSRTWYVAILIQDYSKPNPGLPPKCLIT